MAQIIKQPNGKFCIWSSVVDDLVLINATREDIIEDRIASVREQITKDVDTIINKLNNGINPYFQFTITFEEAIEYIKKYKGKTSDSLRILKEGGLIDAL